MATPEDNQIQPTPEYEYDPKEALLRSGQLQNRLMNAIDELDPLELLKDAKVMEGVNALLNNVNGTAVQVMRNSIVEANSNHGILADAVIDRMEERGVKLIRESKDSGRQGNIPKDIDVSDADFEAIDTNMLVKGITSTNFDEFAEANNIQQFEAE